MKFKFNISYDLQTSSKILVIIASKSGNFYIDSDDVANCAFILSEDFFSQLKTIEDGLNQLMDHFEKEKEI